MNDFVVQGFMDILGFTPKQVFTIIVLYIIAPKLFTLMSELFSFLRRVLGCGFEMTSKKVVHNGGKYEEDIKLFINTKTRYEYFKTETKIDPPDFPRLRIEDMEINANPPEEYNLGLLIKTTDSCPECFVLNVIVTYKKKYRFKKRKKTFSFTYQG